MTTTDNSARLTVDAFLELEQKGMSRDEVLVSMQEYCGLLPKFDSLEIAFEDLDRILIRVNPQAFARFVKLTAELRRLGYASYRDIGNYLSTAMRYMR